VIALRIAECGLRNVPIGDFGLRNAECGEPGGGRQKAGGRRRKAEGSEKLPIAECGLRNGEKPIAECGMNEALQIDPANPQSEIRNPK
jgi:hypothetical protein